MLGLHFVRERITSTDRKIQGSDDMVIIVSFIPYLRVLVFGILITLVA